MIEIVSAPQGGKILNIQSKVDNPIRIQTNFSCNLRPGFISHQVTVTKDAHYQTVFLNVSEQKFFPSKRDYRGIAKLEVDYHYQNEIYKDIVVWQVFITKNALGIPRPVYKKDGSAEWWLDINDFQVVKKSHRIYKKL